jgi:hypothetical protein
VRIPKNGAPLPGHWLSCYSHDEQNARIFYRPTPEDIALTMRLFPNADPYNPNWFEVQVRLIGGGSKSEDLLHLSPPDLLQLVDELRSEQNCQDEEAFRIEAEPGSSKWIADAATKSSEESESPSSALLQFDVPVTCAEVCRVIGQAAGRSDAFARRMRSKGFRVELAGGKYHCELTDAIRMFTRPEHKKRLREHFAEKN